MTEIFPDSYLRFHCLADRCRHSCCIGWEIDIDDATAASYAQVPGQFGKRLRDAMEGEPPHFRLDAAERCPLLNERNLCDLILTLGEAQLCEICTEHPRFHHRLGGRLESGVGLCCEAAAALLMGQTEPDRLRTRTGRIPVFHGLPALRQQLLDCLQERTKPLEQRCRDAMLLCGGRGIAPDPVRWAQRFLSLEQMEAAWTARLQDLAAHGGEIDFPAYMTYAKEFETEYEQLLCYFVYRHFAGIARSWTNEIAFSFALLCCGMIFALHALHFTQHGGISFEERVDYARQFSAEIEYSDENPERLLAFLAAMD